MKHSEFVVECSRIHTANIGIHPNLKSSHSVSARMCTIGLTLDVANTGLNTLFSRCETASAALSAIVTPNFDVACGC